MTPSMAYLAGILWTGMMGRHPMECDVVFIGEETPPPDRPSHLGINGTCSADGIARSLNGWDSNGPIRIQACDVAGSECCDLSALGPSTIVIPDVTAEPNFIAGTYQCGDGPLGVFAMQPGVCKPRDEGSACPKVRRKVRKHRRG